MSFVVNGRDMSNELDNYITGHYGEDQFKDCVILKDGVTNTRFKCSNCGVIHNENVEECSECGCSELLEVEVDDE